MEVTAATAVFGAIFAGVTGVADVVSAYEEYRKDHRGRNRPGPRSDSVQLYPMKLMQQQSPFYLNYVHLLPKSACEGSGFRDNLKGGIKRLLHRTKSMSKHVLEGKIELFEDVQQAPDTHRDDYVGLNTGKQPMYQMEDAGKHWATFQNGSACNNTAAPTIAVLNWTTAEITMFIQNKQQGPQGMFFRNYRVHNPNLLMFAKQFQRQMACSGIVEKGRLVGTCSGMFLAEDQRSGKLQSINSWRNLCFKRTRFHEETYLFLEMNLAVLIGLVECTYKDPTLLNVDILHDANKLREVVFVDTDDPVLLSYRDDNFFSVFAFNYNEYSQRRVLVG